MFRPVLFYPAGAGCWQPWVKGFTMMTNSIYNNWRMEASGSTNSGLMGFALLNPSYVPAIP